MCWSRFCVLIALPRSEFEGTWRNKTWDTRIGMRIQSWTAFDETFIFSTYFQGKSEQTFIVSVLGALHLYLGNQLKRIDPWLYFGSQRNKIDPWLYMGTNNCTWEVGQDTKIFPAVLGIWAKSSTCTWEQILYCTWDHHPLTDLQNENDTFFWTVKIFNFFWSNRPEIAST